jgi:hypothetical protein
VPAQLFLAGVSDPAAALRQVLASAGAQAAPGVADLGALLDAQLDADAPLDAYAWAPYEDGAVIRYLPGGDGGLAFELPRALSAVTRGLVLAMETVRTRDRYAVGSFLSGRTIELERCIEGVASSPAARALCHEDAVEDAFAEWLSPIVGQPVQSLSSLGALPTGALLATPLGEIGETEETPLARIARRRPDGALRVLEHPGELLMDEVMTPVADRPAIGVELRGAGAPTRWVIANADGSAREGVAPGQAALANVVPAWALAAPR